MASSDLLMWLDFETTDDNVLKTEVLEVAAFFTRTDDLVKLDYPEFNRVIKITPNGMERLFNTPVVVEMHSKSGLLADVANSTINYREARNDFFEWFMGKTEGVKVQMAGSGVAAFDMPIMRGWCYEVFSRLSYSSYDVGHFRRIVAGSNAFTLKNLGGRKENIKHRALDDINDHWEEALAYRTWLNDAQVAMEVVLSEKSKLSEHNKKWAGTNLSNYFDLFKEPVSPEPPTEAKEPKEKYPPLDYKLIGPDV